MFKVTVSCCQKKKEKKVTVSYTLKENNTEPFGLSYVIILGYICRLRNLNSKFNRL